VSGKRHVLYTTCGTYGTFISFSRTVKRSKGDASTKKLGGVPSKDTKILKRSKIDYCKKA
jgi:hypothetical protein